MSTDRSLTEIAGRLVLNANGEPAFARGYPWVFQGHVQRLEGAPETGQLVHLVSPRGHILGVGFYHATSAVIFRMLSRDPHRPLDEGFFRDQIFRALSLRERYYAPRAHYRLCYAEADNLPGMLIDRYNDVLSFSTVCAGMDQRKHWVLQALHDRLNPTAIIERNDSPLRAKEDLEEKVGVYAGSWDGPVEIHEDGVTFEVDVMGGLKTGFFLDQQLNRYVTRRLARDQRVLDVFCADGGFGLHAAAGGAASVHFIDSSAQALTRAEANAQRSGLSHIPMTFERADAVPHLGAMVREGKNFDLVILDPPAFARSKKHRDTAIRAYQRINISGFQLLSRGGILATASCSGAVTEEDFMEVVRYSARRAGVSIRILHQGGHGPDHPILDAMSETHYLKFVVVQVV